MCRLKESSLSDEGKTTVLRNFLPPRGAERRERFARASRFFPDLISFFLFSLTSLLRPPSLSPPLRVPLSQRRPLSVPLPQPAVPLPLFLPHRRRRFPYPSASTPSLSPNRRRRFPSSPTGDAASPAPQPGRPSPGSRRLSRGALTPSSPWPAVPFPRLAASSPQ